MSAHTPGPWVWTVNPKNFEVDLSRGAYGDSVLRFDRWGMSGATPLFRVNGLLKRAVDLSVPQVGREHHAAWWRIIDHPDARLIAAAPELLAACRLLLDSERSLGDLCTSGCRPGINQHTQGCAVAVASAAIAKAEGRS